MAGSRKTIHSGDIFALFFLMQICLSSCLSAEIQVPDEYATITEALAVAGGDNTIDTILVAPGTYSEPNEAFPLRIRKAITLMCDTDDPNNRPHLKGDGKHTVVLIESGGVTLRGFRITDGSGSEGINSMDGGGICVFVGPGETRDVNIVNCLIENNTCPSDETYDGCGGGIYCGGTYCECFTVNISNCIIRNNSIHGCGGGVFCALLSIVDMNDSYIEDNKADDHGGGVFVDFYASINMNKTHLARNKCPGDPQKEHWGGKGGGMACESLGIFTATDCSFDQNSAKYYGGGIFTRGGLFDVNDLCGRNSEFSYVASSLIRENRADVSGGGVYIASSGILGFSNTTLYWNDARQDGGAVFVAGGAVGGGVVDLNSGCLLEGNESAHYGGGVYLGSNALGTFVFTRFIGNSALFDGGAVFLEEDASAALTECRLVYNNSARGYAGGIRAASQSWLDIMHCSIVGNFAPRMRSGLYLDPNSVVNIRDSILWRNAGGSVDANGAIVSIGTSLSEDGADPNNGVICCDPKYVGWDGLEEIYVDSLAPYPGVGTLENPYHDLQVALDDFDFSLAEGSPCMNTASDGGNMGANTGIGDYAGSITAKLNIVEGTYDIRGRNITFIRNVQGKGYPNTTIKNSVLGCVENASVRNLAITGEEIFGGIVIRTDVALEDCYVYENKTLSDGGGVYIADGNCIMTNTLISGNTSPDNKGGGIFLCSQAILEMFSSSIRQNRARYGGGSYFNVDSTASIISSDITANSVVNRGGGLFVDGQATITDVNIVNNSTNNGRNNDGGGIWLNDNGVSAIQNCRFLENKAGWRGGAITTRGGIEIRESQFESNVSRSGGAILFWIEPDGPSNLFQCQFLNNRATYEGGAVYAWEYTAPLFRDCEFIGNESDNRGGAGICFRRAHPTFDHCHFTSNRASNNGGAFFLYGTGSSFFNCEFQDSSSGDHGGVLYLSDSDASIFRKCSTANSDCGQSGGAFYITDLAQPVFSNIQITESRATNSGGGIAMFGTSKPKFFNVTISNCQAIYGGGIYAASQSESIFVQCEFKDNQAYELTTSADGGGAFFTENVNGWFTRCTFVGNKAQDDGGGMGVAEQANVDLHNTLFVSNSAIDDGGGIHFTSQSVGTFRNCTLTFNESRGGTGAGIYLEIDSTVNVDSSIICWNDPDGIRPDAYPNVNYSCTQEFWPGLGNLICDDCLLDMDTFGLPDSSQCIDAGNPDPNMNDGCQPPGKGGPRNDMGMTGGPKNCMSVLGEDFNFVSFSEPIFLVLRGNALLANGVLHLNETQPWQVGGAWYALPIHVQRGFITVFDFCIDRDTSDGLAFVIQNAGLAALGTNGGYLGYNIPNSIAVEFDTWRNGGFGDPNPNHLSIHTRGLAENSPHHQYSLGSSDSIPFLSDNKIHTVKIIYVQGLLRVYVDDLRYPALTVSVDLEKVLSLTDERAFIGFTASTGSLFETHDILRWAFVSTAMPQ